MGKERNTVKIRNELAVVQGEISIQGNIHKFQLREAELQVELLTLEEGEVAEQLSREKARLKKLKTLT